MKGQIKYIWLPIIFCGITLYCVWYFYSSLGYTLEGVAGKSSNIEESKQRKVFISNYKVIPNPIVINDSIKLEVKDCWIEKKWFYGDKFNKTRISKLPELNNYTLIIKARDTLVKYDYYDYFEFYKYRDTVGINSLYQYFNGSLGNYLYVSYPRDKLPQTDTFHIYSKHENRGAKRLSGTFVIQKTSPKSVSN